MKIPKMQNINKTKVSTSEFKGINHTNLCGEGEWYDELNLSSSEYPYTSVRHPNTPFTFPTGFANEDIYGLYADKFGSMYLVKKENEQYNLYFANSNTYIRETKVELQNTDTIRRFTEFGTYLLIMPDRVYINTQSVIVGGGHEGGNIDATFEARGSETGNTTSIYPYSIEDGVISPTCQATPPENPQNNDYWIDTSLSEHKLKVYSASSEQWLNVINTYVMITMSDYFGEFSGDIAELRESDSVSIAFEGISESISEELKKQIEAIATNKTIYKLTIIGEHMISLVVSGIIDTEAVSDITTCRISRTMPDVDYLTSAGNRVWGCNFTPGKNEIYASKLGDFKNWNSFNGISTDSYAVSLGVGTFFTGAATYGDNPMFLKEDYIIMIYGDMPSNFRTSVNHLKGRGCKRFSDKSICNVNGALYWLSKSGVCRYGGDYPTVISFPIQDYSFGDARALFIKDRYILFSNNYDGDVFIYDTKFDLWHREGNCKAGEIVEYENQIVYLSADNLSENTLIIFADESRYINTLWYARTAKQFYTINGKYISKISIRLKFPEAINNLYMHVKIRYDDEEINSSENWIQIANIVPESSDTICKKVIEFVPQRCDHFELLLEGRGNCNIIEIVKSLEIGSDL